MKIGLAEKVAGMLEEERERAAGSGENMRKRVVGWEKVNGDFKL